MKSVLEKLHIQEINPGACTGPDAWIADPNGKELVSYNPTSCDPLATVAQGVRGLSLASIRKGASGWRTSNRGLEISI